MVEEPALDDAVVVDPEAQRSLHPVCHAVDRQVLGGEDRTRRTVVVHLVDADQPAIAHGRRLGEHVQEAVPADVGPCVRRRAAVVDDDLGRVALDERDEVAAPPGFGVPANDHAGMVASPARTVDDVAGQPRPKALR
jgi:hypothetical protein